MSNMSLYVREEDQPVWDNARRYAATTGTSVSQLVVDLLREHIPTVAVKRTRAARKTVTAKVTR